MRGSLKDNKAYCSKPDTKAGPCEYGGFEVFIEPVCFLTEEKMYSWQRNIVNICKGKPSRRTIYWFYEKEGNYGKSVLGTYICDNLGGIICGGKYRDIFYMLSKRISKRINTKVIIFDLPRNVGNRVSYNALEDLQNGRAFSSKYESDYIRFAIPHILVFANTKPVISEMSKDRWKIVNLRKNVKDI